ncbi:MAG: SusD/RagB family nutrient-binding outer membrane lipoprotein [Prevotellaceae bacterium]|nr:SusD/RagB family nutrient-binding outer membrane lipoprotein [Prevotellaceae bacterium]
MKHIKTMIAAFAALAMVATSCNMGDFDDLNVNPNKPGVAYTSMLFTYSAQYVSRFTMNSSSFDPWMQLRTGYLSEAKNNQYGAMTTTVNFSTGTYYYYVIKNLNTIIEMNRDEDTKDEISVTAFGDNANQIAAAQTLRCFFFMMLTDIVGPLPYSEAFKGESEDIWEPKFDSQEEIYTGLNEELEEAYSQFDTSGSLSDADILYNGDISKWKKFNASLRMMLAIKLADVAPDTGKERFAKAYSDGAMTDVEDGLHYTFSSNSEYYSWMYYVGNMNYSGANLLFAPNKVIVDALKEYQDPRMFSYFTLDGYRGTVDGDPEDFDAYIGIPFGLESNSVVLAAANGACSVAASYCEAQATYGVITTARTLLVEAEAAERGWISADAKSLYEAGIRASFDFQAAYHTGVSGVDDYIASDKVALSSDTDTAIDQIVMQRFLAGFMTCGVESWSDWRRFNIPILPIYQGQLDNGVTVYPYRLCYGDNDKLYNVEQSTDAINKYLNGNDDMWERLWWDVADNI